VSVSRLTMLHVTCASHSGRLAAFSGGTVISVENNVEL
jgi:hypothetical protein